MAKVYRPWLPAEYDKNDALAVQAVAQGVGSADQQKRAMRFIVEECCRTYDEPYFEGSTENTHYALGKQHVGRQIVKMINLPPEVLNWTDIKRAVQPKATKERK